MGVQYLAIKDMAGLLAPRDATILVFVLREEITGMPPHMTFPRPFCPPRLWEICPNSWYLRICLWRTYPIGPRRCHFRIAWHNT